LAVDRRRIEILEELVAEIGPPDPEAARLIYAAYVGLGTLATAQPHADGAAMARLIDALYPRKALQ
jgi:hypothetical protein